MLDETVDSYSKQYQKRMEFSTETEKQLKEMNQKICALEERVMHLEQNHKECYIDIIVLQKPDNRNPREMVANIARLFYLNTKDIDEAKTFLTRKGRF